MKEKDWATWATVAGNIAVVATLAILIVGLHENTKLVERQAAVDRYARIVDPYLTMPDFAEIYGKIKARDGMDERHVLALAERYDLTVPEAVRWARHIELIWAGLEADFRLHGWTAPLDRQMRALLEYPDQRIYWEAIHRDHSDPFSTRVRRIARESTVP
jgi:hypothetical protein